VMDGEAIYRGRHSASSSVLRTANEQDELVNGYRVALHIPETNSFRTNPAEVLGEAGIRVERYQRDPHKLVVLPETLRAAGIPLGDFVLV
jgi:hypothetical protein